MNDRSDRPLTTPEDDSDRKLLLDVQEHGWHVIGVQADDEGPSFAYSIGLYETFRQPEVIVFGLGINVMHEMINVIGERIREGGRFSHLDEVGDILNGYNVFFRDVEKKYYREYLGCAGWFYQSDRFPVLQCVWPDSLHRFPWHPLFNQNLAALQPVLSD